MKAFSMTLKKSALIKVIHVLLFSLFFLSACSSPTIKDTTNKTVALNPTSGFGGTGYKPSSGFGGTGNSSSGFGGTGIVGTVTQFGSIWVNGVRIAYGKDTQITSKLLAADKLKLGQQVILETLPLNDKTQTQKIQIYYPIAGEITSIEKGQIIVNHRYVVKMGQSRIDKGLTLKKGEFVAINGFSDSAQNWTATRVNANTRHKIFYYPVPKLNFSSAVKQVLIESTAQQLKQWSLINKSLMRIPNNQSRFILRGRYKNHRIQLDSIKAYSNAPRRALKKQKVPRHKMQGRRMFQQQKNMLGIHKQQGRMRGKHY